MKNIIPLFILVVGVFVAGCQKDSTESGSTEATNAVPPAETTTNYPESGMPTNAVPANPTNEPVK